MMGPNASSPSDRIRLSYKIIGYVAAWAIALLLTAPGMWALAYMFPLGLLAVVNKHLANDGGWGVFFGLYLVYIVHAWFYFRSQTSMHTAILFGVLVLLLTCNVVGCHEMIHSH
jgi:uncharacterized membrane protein